MFLARLQAEEKEDRENRDKDLIVKLNGFKRRLEFVALNDSNKQYSLNR